MTAGNRVGKWRQFIASKRWDSLWLFVLTKVLPVGAAVLVSLIWRYPDRWAQWLSLGVPLYIAAFAIDTLTRLSERQRRQATDDALSAARRTTTESICYAFTRVPEVTTEFFSQLRSGDEHARQHLDRYLGELLEHVTKVVLARDIRVCLYLVDAREVEALTDSGASDGTKSLLLLGNGHGRPDPPRPWFDGATAHGAFVLQRMNDRRVIRVANTDAPPSGYALDCHEKGYKSFLAVPIAYNADEYGMLMLDSPEVGGLTHEHEVIAQLFARFVGSGLHLMQSTPARPPRVSEPAVTVDITNRGGV